VSLTVGLANEEELRALFLQKHGKPEATGWAPSRRFRFGYFTPSDVYEATVAKVVAAGCRWLDVGGGRSMFPENPTLARTLAERARVVVAVDPSGNVHDNDLVHERINSTLEGFTTDTPFDLATIRMVVEHVENPSEFVASLSRAVKPGGIVVVLTVNLWSPVTFVSRLVPFRLHHAVKKLFWGGFEEDTFPAHYRMNTRLQLAGLFEQAGFVERDFRKVGDLSVFGKFRVLNYVELLLWRALDAVGVSYPENCLIGVYQRDKENVRESAS